MKTFGATLAAILVAAAVIGLFIEAKSHFEAVAEAKAEAARLEKDRRDREAQREKEEKEGATPGLAERIHRKREERFKSPTPSPY